MSHEIDLKKLRKIFEKGWGPDTCYEGESGLWSRDVPSSGQCYVTARLVQHFFEGEILRFQSRVEEINHYWNLLPDGREVDLTGDQFDGWKCKDFLPPPAVSGRGKVTRRFVSMNSRVKKLLSRIGDDLAQLSGREPEPPGSGPPRTRKKPATPPMPAKVRPIKVDLTPRKHSRGE